MYAITGVGQVALVATAAVITGVAIYYGGKYLFSRYKDRVKKGKKGLVTGRNPIRAEGRHKQSREVNEKKKIGKGKNGNQTQIKTPTGG